MRALVPVAALLIALTGCGGDVREDPGADEPPTASTPTDSRSPDAKPSKTATQTPEPTRRQARTARKAFESWLGAMAVGDAGRACALQTGRFTRSQLERAVERDLVQPGVSCGVVVEVASKFYEAFGIDLASADVAQVPSSGDRVAFTVVLPEFATIGYALIPTDDGWRVHEDLTAS
jgi:hypothetical protein